MMRTTYFSFIKKISYYLIHKITFTFLFDKIHIVSYKKNARKIEAKDRRSVKVS